MIGDHRLFRLTLAATFSSLALSASPCRADGVAPEVSRCLAAAPSGLEAYWKPLCASPRKDLTLHQMQAGQAAFAAGYRQEAESLFDQVLTAIEAVYTESESAAKARSVWYSESEKDFKGEPHERVMAYYYRGLLYLLAGDWDNAQASFKGGVLQGTFVGLDRQQSSTASLVWLEGWSRHCAGADSAAKDLFAEAHALNPGLAPPPIAANALVIAETGTGPRKQAIGRDSDKLAYLEGKEGNDGLMAMVAGRRTELMEAEDLFRLATSRNGRQMDELLADKSRTKDAVRTAGNSAVMVGSAAMVGSRLQNTKSNSSSNSKGAGAAGAAGAVGTAGAIISLIGIVASATAAAMETTADIRTWETLPHSIRLAAIPAPPEGLTAETLSVLSTDGSSVLSPRARLQIASPPHCSLAWVGSASLIPSGRPTAVQPGTDAGAAETCRTPSGAAAALTSDICQRIGGTVIQP